MSNVDEILSLLKIALKAELRDEVRAEIIAELSGGKPVAKKTPGKPGPKPKAATPSTLKVKPGVRRTEEEVAAAATKLLGWFKANPNSRIDQAATALGVTVKDLSLPLSKLKAEKKLAKKGKLRGTTYTAK